MACVPSPNNKPLHVGRSELWTRPLRSLSPLPTRHPLLRCHPHRLGLLSFFFLELALSRSNTPDTCFFRSSKGLQTLSYQPRSKRR